MRNWKRAVFFAMAAAGVVASSGAFGQNIRGEATIALKSGESADVYPLGMVANCKSTLTALPQAEILDGPPGVTVSVKEDMIVPRGFGCSNRVKGGTLVITAKDIEDFSYTPLTVRVTYKTKDGERKFSHVFNLSLVP